MTHDTVKIRAGFLAVLVVSFICFIPDLYNELLEWDDLVFIVNNDHIKSITGETIRWAFLESYENYWGPLLWVSFALDYAVWGLNPVGYHLANNIYHALNAGLFFLLSWELLKRYKSANGGKSSEVKLLSINSSVYCSVLAALFFSLHPLRVESVAWASERNDVLSLFFGLLAVLAYLKHTQQVVNNPGHAVRDIFSATATFYWLSFALFCLSLLVKPMLVTLPFVFFILDWFPLKRFNTTRVKWLFLEKLPFLILAALTSALTMVVQRPLSMSLEESNMLSRAINAFKSVMAYFQLSVWPLNLSPFYLHPRNITVIGIEYSLPIAFFIFVTSLCIFTLKRKPVFMAVWLIYLITLLPVLGFTQTGPQAMAARYTYVPGLSLSLLAAIGITFITVRLSDSRPAVIAMIFGTLLLLLTGCYITVQHISFWKDDVALWTRVIELQPHFSGRAYFQRSHAYVLKGDLTNALTDINEALSIASDKKYKLISVIYVERARILSQMGDLNGAIADYSMAIDSDATSNRSMYYYERGDTYKKIGRTDLANDDYRQAAMSNEGK